MSVIFDCREEGMREERGGKEGKMMEGDEVRKVTVR